MVATTPRVKTKTKQTSCVRLAMPENAIKSGTSPNTKSIRSPSQEIHLIIPAACKTKVTYLEKRWMLQHRSPGYLLISICIAILITILVMIQHNFMETIQKELATIHKMSNVAKVETPPIQNDEVAIESTILDVADEDGKVVETATEKPGNHNAIADITTTIASPYPVDERTEKGSATVTHNDKMKTFDQKTIKEKENPYIQSVPDNDEQSVEKANIYPIQNEMEDEVDFHSHERTDKTMDLKMDVVSKIYTYIYAFYITVIFLIILQFIVIIRLLSDR